MKKKKKEGFYTFLSTTNYDKLFGWPSLTIRKQNYKRNFTVATGLSIIRFADQPYLIS